MKNLNKNTNIKNQKYTKSLIIGVGNPIISDDAIGIIIANEIKKLYPKLEVYECGVFDVSLVDKMSKYDRVIIIDSIKTEKVAVGEVVKLTIKDLDKFSHHIAFSHGINLSAIIQVGKKLGYKIPKIEIFAIEAKDITTFNECCTNELKQKIPNIVHQIINQI